ncbi:MAG TPA: hypothetical protein VE404_06645 [Verrucomicrobiae bacterium]|nr:hypothetical protein [Verrucomicrobiae bacterium]
MSGPVDFPAATEQAGLDRRWSLRDIPRAIPISFDPRTLLVGAVGLFLASAAFGMAHWLGVKTGEAAAGNVFNVAGAIAASCIWVVFAGIIARLSLTRLIEGRRAGADEIRRFLTERWTTLVGTPVAFGCLGLVFLGFMALIELIGAVPGIGPIIFGASFLLVFLLAFMAALTAVVHTLGTFLYPSIIALRGVGALGILMEMFQLVRRRGFTLLLYEFVVGVAGMLMTAVLGSVVWAGLYIANWSALAIMDSRFEQSLGAIPESFRVFLRPFERWLPYVPAQTDVPWHYDLSGLLLGISLLCIVVATAVYPFVFFNTAGSITYLILRRDNEAERRET